MYVVNIIRQMWESPCEESTREEESEQNVNVRRCFGMCYLIAKNNQGGSSLAIQMMHGKELAKLKQKLLSDLPGEEIQLLTVSRPSAYTEYEPFCFMDTPDHFAQEVKNSFS